MKVTVIIPTYNRAEYIGHAIASILRQRDAVDLDILVVDDGSTDDTSSILHDIVEANHGVVRVVSQENRGIAVARNAGLANLLPETKYVTFLDSDDVVPPGRYAADMSLFQKDPQLDMTYGRLVLVQEINYQKMMPTKVKAQGDGRGIGLCCSIFRREFMEKVGTFDEEFVQSEDLDYFLRVSESNPCCAVTDVVSVYYLRHDGNITKRIDEGRRFFLRALHKSVVRRREDPTISPNKLGFDVREMAAARFH